MEYLLVSCIRRGSDLGSVYDRAQIFDVSQYHVCWLALILMVLASSDWSDVRRNPGIYDNVISMVMSIERQTSKNLEPASVVDFVGDVAQSSV